MRIFKVNALKRSAFSFTIILYAIICINFLRKLTPVPSDAKPSPFAAFHGRHHRLRLIQEPHHRYCRRPAVWRRLCRGYRPRTHLPASQLSVLRMTSFFSKYLLLLLVCGLFQGDGNNTKSNFQEKKLHSCKAFVSKGGNMLPPERTHIVLQFQDISFKFWEDRGLVCDGKNSHASSNTVLRVSCSVV